MKLVAYATNVKVIIKTVRTNQKKTKQKRTP